MRGMTSSTKADDIKRGWHLINTEDKILGRVATDIAKLLMGKNKPYFVRNLDCGDHVVVINSKNISVTGKKEEQKVYSRHSGYPGGLKQETLKDLRVRRPNEIIRHAVRGMLPQNRLRDRMLKRLHVFENENHTYQDKFNSVKGE